MNHVTNLSPKMEEVRADLEDLYFVKKTLASLPSLPNGILKDRIELALASYATQSSSDGRLARIQELDDAIDVKQMTIQTLNEDIESLDEIYRERRIELESELSSGKPRTFLIGAAVGGVVTWMVTFLVFA